MKLSVIIPAHNESGSIKKTVENLISALKEQHIPHEIIAVNDHSTDNTKEVLANLQSINDSLIMINNHNKPGYGNAVREGLNVFSGDAVAVMMGDASDLPSDLIKFYQIMRSENVDCVFGSRFCKEGKAVNYPWLKFIFNRIFNNIIRLLFCIKYNDVTNAFKLYRKNVIHGVSPLLSPHFNLTVEIPLKAIVRNYSYKVVPNTWINRKEGESKLKIKEMGSRYLFIIIYCFIEKWLTKDDYQKN